MGRIPYRRSRGASPQGSATKNLGPLSIGSRNSVGALHTSARGAGRLAGDRLLYERLGNFADTRVIEINRAIAVANARGVKEGLALIAMVEEQGGLEEFQPFWAAKAELHARAGFKNSSTAAYDRAIGLERDPAVREFLLAKRAEVAR